MEGGKATERAGGTDLSDLYRRRRADMIRLARLLTGSAPIAEDVVQEAFLRLQQHAGPIEHPDAYLRATVANLARSHLRRLGVERRIAPQQRLVLSDPELDETWRLLCELPQRQRAVLALRFYEDLPEADIAELLGCRLGTVKSSLHRGLATMRRKLS